MGVCEPAKVGANIMSSDGPEVVGACRVIALVLLAKKAGVGDDGRRTEREHPTCKP